MLGGRGGVEPANTLRRHVLAGLDVGSKPGHAASVICTSISQSSSGAPPVIRSGVSRMFLSGASKDRGKVAAVSCWRAQQRRINDGKRGAQPVISELLTGG